MRRLPSHRERIETALPHFRSNIELARRPAACLAAVLICALPAAGSDGNGIAFEGRRPANFEAQPPAIPSLPQPEEESRIDLDQAPGPTDVAPESVDAVLDAPPPLVGAEPGDSQGPEDELLLLDEPAFAYSSGDWFFTGGWYFEEEVMVLLKTKLNDVRLTIDDSANPFFVTRGPLVMTTTTESPSYEPGGRITLGKILHRDVWNRDHMLEFRFLGMFEWETRATVVQTADSGLGLDTRLGPNSGDVAALYNNTTQRYFAESNLFDYEWNYRIRTRSTRDRMVLQHDGHWIRHSTPSRIWSGYVGVATLFVDETFDLRGQGPGAQSGRYVVETDNELFGVQCGGEYREQLTHWSWGLRGRLATLFNFAERRSSFRSTLVPMGGGAPVTTVRTERVTDDNLALLIEGGLFTSLQVRPNVTLRAGYDILFITGLAQADGNLGLPVGTFRPMQVNDDAIYHGGSLGFTMVW